MNDTDWPPSRREAARKAAIAFVERLAGNEPGARVAVVAYGTRAKTMCRLTNSSKSDVINKSLEAVDTLGLTNITDGLRKAKRLLRSSKRACQAVLLTDGHHNHGRGPLPVADALRQIAVIECVGIGQRSEVDEVLLTSIASANPDGSKRYRWIGDPEGLVQHFQYLATGISAK